MNKPIVKLLASLSLIFSSNIIAEGFNDNYIQLGYGSSGYSTLEYELISSIPIQFGEPRITEPDLAEQIIDISGSMGFGDNYSLIGSYSRETGDWIDSSALFGATFGTCCLRNWDATSTQFSLGVGKSFDLNAKNLGDVTLSYTQLTTSLSTVKHKSKLTSVRHGLGVWNDISKKTNFNIFSMGVRTISNLDIEWAAKYNRLAGNGINFDQFEVEASKNFRKNLALGGKVVSQKNGNKAGFFVRASF